MSALPVTASITIDEYLEQEAGAQEKHEFYCGEIFAMAGGSIEHNQIVRNVLTALDNFLKDKNRQVFPSDLKVHVEANSLFTYPDISVVCGPLQCWRNRNDVIVNPAVIIEVMDTSIRNEEWGRKAKQYRAILSLQEYILISSTEILIEHYTKQTAHSWMMHEKKGAAATLDINTFQFSCPVSLLYRDVSFPATDTNR